MSSTVIRDCWNQGLKPEEFVEVVVKNHMDSFESIVQNLAIICGVSQEEMVLIYEYLACLFQKYSNKTSTAIDLNNRDQTFGCILTFSKFGEKIFNPDIIDSIDSCKTALRILEITLTCHDNNLLGLSLTKISQSHYLPVCVAASRVLCPECFQIIQSKFENLKSNFDIKCIKNHLEVNLVSSISNDAPHPSPKMFFSDHVISVFFILFHTMFSKLYLLRLHNLSVMGFIYITLLDSFVSSPQLTKVYCLTCVLVPVLHAKMHNEMDNYNDSPQDFDIDKFIEVMNNIPDDYFKKYNISKKEHIEEFCKPYSTNTGNYLKEVLQFPSLISQILPHYKEMILSDNLDLIKRASTEIIANNSDFCFILYSTNKIESFLTILLNKLEHITDLSVFTELFFCIVSIISEIWRSGDSTNRKIIETIVTSSSNPSHTLFSLFLHISSVDPEMMNYATIQNIYNAPSHIERCCSFFHYLYFIGIQNLETLFDLLQQYPYLWISVFAWGFQTNSKDSLKIFKIKFPNYPIFSNLFSQLIIRVSDDKKFALTDYADFDTLIQQPQKLNLEIENYLNYIFGKSQAFLQYPASVFGNFIMCCHCFSAMNREKELVLLIFDIVSKVPDVYGNEEILEMMIGIISSTMSLVFNGNSEKAFIVIQSLLEFLSNNETGIREVKLIVSFCNGMITSMKEGFEERIRYVVDFCQSVIEGTNKSQKISIFAYYFMKVVIYIKPIRDLIPISAFHIFNLNGDLKASIDFFKMKADSHDNLICL
ncbi:hypothetical protein TVAG_017680 [Trichomonas vaginalis G3]|uniref:Uncharacterized protein n=1 Tax=Trichomonas vaginalis (strain ATCC PRA-98 / G3) TaxID=412133 RepID=A2G0K2_TRIV3|nr:hypothetical protein TVAGG3_0102740 [Trichomonas vaginalis G3]EAX89319.1 hypothetical protein TVAG_017680 [Trichomonas vaginalis G3]KAI5544468.1 hypothetical protein TVAGG3_0102740 [Trichomonas vaginalis G3]|eukprot:XP_001302249.1 hypothetical protein [Trichomonas vaginalis G3]